MIPRAYIEREWTKYLEFRDFVDDRTLSFQAIVVMQKPFDDFKKRSEKFESKAKMEDTCLNQLETRLHFLESALIERNSYIRSMESLLNEKETALNNIYKSRVWKGLLICCRLMDKVLGR